MRKFVLKHHAQRISDCAETSCSKYRSYAPNAEMHMYTLKGRNIHTYRNPQLCFSYTELSYATDNF